MSAGTLALTNDSDVVVGTSTTFSTELTTGDFMVSTIGGITYTLPVKTVNNDTQVTLISNYPGPTETGSAWYAVPRATQNLVTAAIVAQATEALRGQNYDKANWQAVFSASGNITVMLPDGSTFTGPSWNKIVELLNDIDPVALQILSDQVHSDAQQVTGDREYVDTKAAQVTLDAQSAGTDAQTAATERSAAESANASAQQAKLDAETAADKLEEFNALTDRINSVAVSEIGEVIWHHSRSNMKAGCVPGDGQTLSRVTYPGLWAMVQAGTVPVVSEATWLADPANRYAYTTGDGSTTFRIPDYNGIYTGSIKGPVLRGDGITSGSPIIQRDAAPNITGSVIPKRAAGDTVGNISISNYIGAFKSNVGSGSVSNINADSAGTWTSGIELDASLSSDSYGRDDATEIRPNAVVGCYVIRVFGIINNPGSIDITGISNSVNSLEAEQLQLQDEVDKLKSTGWLQANDPLVLEYIDWSVATNISSGELLVKITQDSIIIKGLFRGTYANSTTVLSVKKMMPGFTYVHVPYTITQISTATSTSVYVQGNSGLASSTVPVPVITIQPASSSWIMLNTIEICFY